MFKQNLDDHIIKNAKYSQEKSVATKRMIAETHEDEMLLQALKNLNAEDIIVNMKSQEKTKKCNTDKYICQCKEEDCFSSSSKKSSSGMLDSSIIDKSERTNHQGLTKQIKNTKSGILQQKSPIYHESPHELLLPNMINHFSVQPYQNMNIPPVPILYGIMPNVAPHMIGKEKKYINVGIPFTSFQSNSHYLVGNNQPTIHQKPCICSPIIEKHQDESYESVISPSANYIDATNRETTNDLESNDLIDQTEEDGEHFPKLTAEASNEDSLIDSPPETETISHLNYLTDIPEESNTLSPFNLNKITLKSEDFTEQTERNPDTDLSKLTTDYAGINSAPSFIYDGTNDGKFINMEECIQLFGRDVCVLSATSPKMLAKQENNLIPNKYSTIPEYITQMSTRKETMLNNVDYSSKTETIDPYFSSESPINEINKSNININKYLETTNVKPKADVDKASLREFDRYPESIEQISKPDINYDKNKSFNTINYIPPKKLMDPTTDEITKERNKLLGKGKSHTTKLLLNPNDELINSSSKKFLYSTPSYRSSSDEEVNNLKVNQENQIININSESNTSPTEETTINYDSTTGFDKEQNRNLKDSNICSERERKIPQEHFKEEITTTSSTSKIKYNFEEESKKEIETSVHPEEISQEQPTTIQYFDNKISSNLNYKENITNDLEAPIDSSTSRLPFCDNTLLLNSIRKIINDFALDARLTKTKDLNENVLQTQGKNLLPEILQVPNLKNILLVPQIEDTIVEKVKDVLSHVTAIPRRDFTNDWSHGVIKNTMHSILDAHSGFHHTSSPITFEEHKFKNGQWRTNLVTLAPISNQKLSKEIPENLRESIRGLLKFPTIGSQIDHHIVRNMIVQSVKNGLTDDGNDKIYDSIIHTLNDVLQTLKSSGDITSEKDNTLGKSNKVISDEENMDMTFSQETTSETGINVDNSTLNNKQNNLDIKKDTKMDNKRIQITNNQKAKTEFPHLLQLSEKENETTNKAIAKTEENIKDQKLDKVKNIVQDVQDDAEKKLIEPLKPEITYHKAILQNNPILLANNLELNSTETEEYIKNHLIDAENVEDVTHTTITNCMQETSPNYAQVSDGVILKNMAGTDKNIGEEAKHILNERTQLTSTEIDPLIILERIKFNLPPTKYYSPEILKHATNSRIDDKNVEVTTASTNFIQKTSSNYAQSDGVSLQNTAEIKNDGEIKYPLITTGNLISSTNVEHRDNKPKIYLTDKNILESQEKLQQKNFTDDIIKIHEVTTEIQRTYAKTTYFKTEPFTDSPSSSSSYETADIRINNNDKDNNNHNSGNDNNYLIDKTSNIDNAIKAKEVIVSSSKSSARDNIDPQLLRSSIAPNDDISELQRSQLYYISDGVKLPLEIKKLEDGSYALTISKDICEQILTRKCPCCVPLQGYVVRSIQPFNAMVTSTITRRNALKTEKLKEEKERINADYLSNQNDDNLATLSLSKMPVIDFVKKYNLSLNFNEEKVLFNEAGLQNNIQSYDKPLCLSLIKSEKLSEYAHTQSEEKNLNNPDIKTNGLVSENNDAIDRFKLSNIAEGILYYYIIPNN